MHPEKELVNHIVIFLKEIFTNSLISTVAVRFSILRGKAKPFQLPHIITKSAILTMTA